MATIPPDLVPVETDPARIAMQAHWPAAAKSMSFRRPRLFEHEHLNQFNTSAILTGQLPKLESKTTKNKRSLN